MRKYIAIALFCLLSCGKTERTFRHDEKDMRIQAMEMKIKGNEPLEYRVRLFPDKDAVISGGADLQQAMSYNADSLFHLENNGTKIYPDMVEPVPNGVQGSFEYRLLFTNADKDMEDAILIYTDRYINKKIYQLKAD